MRSSWCLSCDQSHSWEISMLVLSYVQFVLHWRDSSLLIWNDSCDISCSLIKFKIDCCLFYKRAWSCMSLTCLGEGPRSTLILPGDLEGRSITRLVHSQALIFLRILFFYFKIESSDLAWRLLHVCGILRNLLGAALHHDALWFLHCLSNRIRRRFDRDGIARSSLESICRVRLRTGLIAKLLRNNERIPPTRLHTHIHNWFLFVVKILTRLRILSFLD